MIQTGTENVPLLACRVPVVGASGSANVFKSYKNPWGIDVLIVRAMLDVTVVATGAATVDIGIAVDATTSNDTLFDGLDVHTATGMFDNMNDTDNGTNGGFTNRRWAAGSYLNVKEASGDVNGLAANLVVTVVPA